MAALRRDRRLEAACKKMLTAASEIVMRNRGREYRTGDPEYILMEFPKRCKISEDFPKGKVDSQDYYFITYRINAVKLLDWLYNKGHSPYDSAMLVKQTKQYEYLDKQIERMFLTGGSNDN